MLTYVGPRCPQSTQKRFWPMLTISRNSRSGSSSSTFFFCAAIVGRWSQKFSSSSYAPLRHNQASTRLYLLIYLLQEHVFVEILGKFNDQNLIVGNVYRSPNSSCDNDMKLRDTRKQRVKINGFYSDILRVKDVLSGTLQGSILGPILFIIYMNTFIHQNGRLTDRDNIYNRLKTYYE